jgi:hypothetical protein
MPCEHYKDALIEVTAGGAAPQGELRAHLAACVSCREAFAQEQSLFAAIDSGLLAAANAEVPPSLLPRVRVGLDEVTLAHAPWTSSWFVLGSTAVAVATLLLFVTVRHYNPRTPPANLTANRTLAPQILPPAQGTLSSASSKKGNSIPKPPVSIARNPGQSEELASRKPTPEILVPHDQEVLLASYAQRWDSRKHAPLVAAKADQSAVSLLEVAPIQITELDVKPLADGDSR